MTKNFSIERIVVITGSRRKDVPMVHVWERLTEVFEGWNRNSCLLISGAQVGVDQHAEQWCRNEGVRYIMVPVMFASRGKRDGHARNTFLLLSAVAYAQLFEVDDENISIEGLPGPESIGTYNCLNQARRSGFNTNVRRPGSKTWEVFQP